MSRLSPTRKRRALLVLLLAALAVVATLDLLGPRSTLRTFFDSAPGVREPVVPEVDDAVRELRKGPPSRP